MKKITRKLIYVFSTIFIISGMLFMIPGGIFASTVPTTGASGSIFLSGDPTNHEGLPYTDFLSQNCDVVLLPGQVLWHLVMTGIADTGTATIGGVEGNRNGHELQWTIINNLTFAPDWEAIVTDGILVGPPGPSTDLKVSHTCYGGPDPQTFSITVVKTSTGFVAGDGDFVFTLYKDAVSQGTGNITAPGGSYTFINLEEGTYTIVETNTLGADGTTWSFTVGPTASNGDANITSDPMVLNADNISDTVYFDNLVIAEENPSFSVNVSKAITGTGFTSFTFELQKQNEETWDVVATLADQPAGGPYTFVPDIPPVTSGTYRVVETNRGGAVNTAVDLVSMPITASGDNSTSAIFTWDGLTTASQSVYFLNDIPGGGGGTPTTIATATTIEVLAIEEDAIEEEVEVAGISEEPQIEVAGISNLPFTGQNTFLQILGSMMFASGLFMVISLVIKSRKANMNQ